MSAIRECALGVRMAYAKVCSMMSSEVAHIDLSLATQYAQGSATPLRSLWQMKHVSGAIAERACRVIIVLTIAFKVDKYLRFL